MKAENRVRTKKTAVNSVVSIITQAVTLVVKFVSRTFFIKYIGVDYLGLNGLFTNVLSILAIAELGLGAAFSIMLYKPLAEGDNEKVNTLVHLCRKVYTIIGIVIIALSVCVTPFIQLLTKDTKLPVNSIRLYFIIFALSSSVTYFKYHQATLLQADQKIYIEKLVFTAVQTVCTAVAIVLMIFTGNYLYYLFTLVAASVVSNLLIAVISSRKYKHILRKDAKKLDEADKKQIKKHVYALIMHQIGAIVVMCTENIIISAMIGSTVLGVYSNYTLIVTSAVALCKVFLTGATASLGNLWATESEDKVYEVFKKYRLLVFWVYALLAIGFFVMVQPFITLWIGEDFLLSFGVVIALTFRIYLFNMRSVTMVFSNTKGLFYQERFKPLTESAVNLVATLVCGYYLGLIGVLIGVIISTVTVCIWWEPIVLYKHGFKKEVQPYFIHYIGMFALFVAAGALTYLLCTNFAGGGIVNFLIRLAVCFVSPNVIFIAAFFETDEFKYYVDIVKKVFKKRRAKPQITNS